MRAVEIKRELAEMEIGLCSRKLKSTRPWGWLVWRVSDTHYAVGKSIRVGGYTMSIDEAVYQLSTDDDE